MITWCPLGKKPSNMKKSLTCTMRKRRVSQADRAPRNAGSATPKQWVSVRTASVLGLSDFVSCRRTSRCLGLPSKPLRLAHPVDLARFPTDDPSHRPLHSPSCTVLSLPLQTPPLFFFLRGSWPHLSDSVQNGFIPFRETSVSFIVVVRVLLYFHLGLRQKRICMLK